MEVILRNFYAKVLRLLVDHVTLLGPGIAGAPRTIQSSRLLTTRPDVPGFLNKPHS